MPGFEVLSMSLVIDNYYRLRYYGESENDLAKCEFYNKTQFCSLSLERKLPTPGFFKSS